MARALKKTLSLSHRYTAFLKACDPLDVETRTPTERIRLIPAADLEREQLGYARGNPQTPANPAWKGGWVIIGFSSLLGDPYFLDTTRPDPEGDCPVMTAMVGSNRKPTLCASNFACFLRILATTMEVAQDFPAEAVDPDDEDIFREALRPKIRIVDPAALREGHWT
ncbi:MAG: SMI1/KNR4 family protein [Deltaproteobacteria bacterium]|nr:SMI1/KNR4 family protein [Deltaproteobacteria bacterium]